MYKINKSNEFIKNVQKFLNLRENGIFDIKTKAELEKRKKEKNISSPFIDFNTFEILKKEHKTNEEYKRNTADQYICLPIRFSDYNDSAKIVNSLMRDIIVFYKLDVQHPTGSLFGEESCKALSALCSFFCLEKKEEVDKEFFNRLCVQKRCITSLTKNKTC